MVKVAISAASLAANRKNDSKDKPGKSGGGWNNIRAQSVASYAWAGMQEDDGPHEFYECWPLCKYQPVVRRWYASDLIQVSVAMFIFFNFLIESASAQSAGDFSTETFFLIMEWFFTLLFTVELAINMFAHWWWRFWQDGWNWFDFIVVAVSLLAVLGGDLPGIAVLRLLRAFRVFRLFKRLESLRKIVKALEESIPGVANAFMILILVMGIYAILGVEFFRNTFIHPVWGVDVNYFANFGQSMFTLFQVMTGESWSEMIARPCIRKHPTLGSVYFVSYVLITMYVLVNVVIAVLLEKLMGDIMTVTTEKYDVFCYGKEFVKRTDSNNKDECEDFIYDAARSWEPAKDPNTGEEVDPRDAERSCVYSHVVQGKLKGMEADLRGTRIIIRPRPDADDPEEEEEYDAEGNLIEEDKKVRLAVEQSENKMSCVVQSVTKMDSNAGKAGYDLVRIQLDKPPRVMEVQELLRWKSGKGSDGKFVGKVVGEPRLREPKKRDGIEQYQIPPEPMADLIARIREEMFGYVDLLTWRVKCVNAQLDKLNDGGKFEQYKLPEGAGYAEVAGDAEQLPYIIPYELGAPEEDELEEKVDSASPDVYDEEQEGGTKTSQPVEDVPAVI